MKLISVVMLLTLSVLPPCFSASEGNKKSVNILFLFTDDQRADSLSYVGNPIVKTPNLDALAAQGTYFENAFVTTAICCVSRASVLTGQYASSSGVQDFFTPIKLETTYPRYLRDGGYYTGFIGKWGTLENDKDYFKKAASLFDFWAGSMGQSNYWHERDCNFVLNNGTTDKQNFHCNCPPDKNGNSGEKIRVGKANIKDPVHQETYVIPKKVRSFLDQRDESKPFCLSISFKAPHGPFEDYDEKFKDLYKGIAMPVAKSVSVEEAEAEPGFLRNSLNGTKMEAIQTAHDLDGELQESMRDYYRLINGIDDAVGQIFQELEKRGLAENTVIIFYSDNGHFMAEHGFHGKWLMHEESIRVPGFIFDPRDKKEGAKSEEMVLNIDIAPTILELAGLVVPGHMDGQSLLPLTKNPGLPFREDFFYEHKFRNTPGPNHIEASEGIRSRDWKYMCYIDQTGADAEELYHVARDPLEMNDLSGAPEHAEMLNKMRARHVHCSSTLSK